MFGFGTSTVSDRTIDDVSLTYLGTIQEARHKTVEFPWKFHRIKTVEFPWNFHENSTESSTETKPWNFRVITMENPQNQNSGISTGRSGHLCG